MNDNIDRKSVGNRIKTGREQMGLTRDQFAEMIDLSISFFTQIERGEKLMSVQSLVKIALKLNLSLDYLIWGDSSIDVNKNSLIDNINNASKKELKVIDDIFKAVLPNLKK